ncbi:hypothetical protein [Streptomyces chumphonensis]|uniref:hypothetical protein n=1 Tax=Streptomyces chumphonensis TaxID=1214925 RepID=UPI003635DD94
MPRRVSLPAADELFRTTGGGGVQPSTPQQAQQAPDAGGEHTVPSASRVPAPAAEPRPEDGTEEHSGRDATRPAPAPEQRGQSPPPVPQAAPQAAAGRAPQPRGRQAPGRAARRLSAPRGPSGRERHDEKITVYVSAEELMDLEHARLVLRGEHGLAVDRGRIVREAVAVVLADLESRGDASILVRRLRGS